MTQDVRGTERRAWVAYSLVALLALLIGWLTYANSRRMLDDQRAVANADHTTLALLHTLSHLQDVETGSRGYVLTGRDDFREPYLAALEGIDEHVAELKLLAEGDAAHEEQVADLEQLIARKLEISHSHVTVRESQGQAAAERLVASGEGNAVMAEVRDLAGAMISAAEEHSVTVVEDSNAATRNSLVITGVLGFLSLALFAILIGAMMRVLSSQRHAADANARLGAIVGASADAVMSLDLERRVASWNPGAEKMFGYTAAEAIGQPISFIAPPDQVQAQSQTVEKLRGGSEAEVAETVRLTKDGRPVDVSVSAFPIHAAAGVLVGFGAIMRDITESKRLTEALRDSERRLASLFDASPAAVNVVRASDLVFLDVNRAWLEMFELDREAVIGRTSVDFGIWSDLSARPQLLERLRTESSARDVELRWRTATGRTIDTITSWDHVKIGGEDCLVSVAIDITARKRAEERLREAEQRWETVFRTSTVGIIISNADDAVITAANQRFLDLLELPRDEVIGRTAESLDIWLDPGERTSVLDHLHVGDGRQVAIRLRSRSGRIVHGVVSTVAVLLNGRLSRVSNLSDVTARVEAERDRERVFTLSPDPMAIAEFDGYLRRVNPAAVDTLGYSEEELLKIPFLDLFHADDREAASDAVLRLANGDRWVTFNGRLRAKDGRSLRVEIAASAEPGERTLYAIVRDVTARWEMAEALRAGEERFRSVVETATDAIIIADSLGNIEVFNPAAERTFGYTAAEVAGQNVRLLAPSPDKEMHDGYIAASLTRTESEVLGLRREVTGQRKDGSLFPQELTVTPMRLGDAIHFTAIIRDIAERKALEAEIVGARLTAEEANRAKSTFLSRMSHELRTPLNVVLGFAQVLQLDPLDPQQTEAVDYILKSGRHLLELIDEVLDISRIEAGRLSLSIEPVHVFETVADILALMQPLGDQRQVTLRADQELCDVFVIADRQRLRQVLLNIVANAVKYNREGGTVDIRCEQVADQSLRIVVTDTGLGIPPEKLERTFVAFDRLGAEATEIDGTGLGLALSQYLMEAMGGTIGVESTLGVGSTFWVELPVGDEPVHAHHDESSSHGGLDHRSPEQRTVLYIEDNLANLNLMERILVGRLGFRMVVAMQGRLGLDLVAAHHPDLIFLDVHLPDMLGTEVLDHLQADPATRDIPVVIVSADATPGQVERLLAAGARAYITKPFDLKELFAVIASLPVGAS